MRFDEQLLKNVTRGALSIANEGGHYRFYRMTDRQADAFTRASEGFESKTTATAGISFDFKTDATIINVKYGAVRKASSRSDCNFDVFVDGNLYMHIVKTIGSDATDGMITVPLDGKTHRVQIYLPNLSNPGIEYIEVNEGALVTPCTPKKVILAHGDSITQGYDAVFPSASYVNTVARHFDACVYNQAIGGACFNPEVVEKLPDTPDLITVAYGTNDWSGGDENFEYNVTRFFERLCNAYPQVTVCVIIPIWRADNDRVTLCGTFKKACDFIRSTASTYGNVKIIEGDTLVPHITDLFSDKYLHPNDLGFKFYADNLISAINE